MKTKVFWVMVPYRLVNNVGYDAVLIVRESQIFKNPQIFLSQRTRTFIFTLFVQ
jgi:hypothetical protein